MMLNMLLLVVIVPSALAHVDIRVGRWMRHRILPVVLHFRPLRWWL
jgi:hypothetical protein